MLLNKENEVTPMSKFEQFSYLGSRDVKFEPTDPALSSKSGPAGVLRDLSAVLPGSE